MKPSRLQKSRFWTFCEHTHANIRSHSQSSIASRRLLFLSSETSSVQV